MKNFIKKILSISSLKKKQKVENWQSSIITYVEKYTMTSAANITSLTNAIKYISEKDIKGDIVECGVWKGGSMMAVAKTLLHLGKTDRNLYLYDTFGEFPAADLIDISFEGTQGNEVVKSLADDGQTWKAPDTNTVLENMKGTGYPVNMLFLIKGKVEETIPATIPEKIALLRLDTDWYSSTLHELEWLFPNVSPGGVIIIDDYGYWQGCKKATDDYFKKQKIVPSLIKIDSSARMMYKETGSYFQQKVQ